MRPPGDLTPLAFEDIPGFAADDLAAAFAVFRRSAERILGSDPEQRPACPPSPALRAAARAALEEASPDGARFFRRWFRPFRLSQRGFVTAYYEPETPARRAPEPGFETPVLARPADLVTLNETPLRLPDGLILTAARRMPDGALADPSKRAATSNSANVFHGAAPIAYLRDAVDLFLIQVQGSARLRLPGGETLALTYDGRNGWPYTSIGRLLIESGALSDQDMSLERLKATLREMGAGPGQPGRRLMHENRSYVFFRIDASPDRRSGPIGGGGCALTPLRSIAVDRSIWSYGLPFWIAASIPWEGDAPTRFERLMIAQDTGSAILGAARADLFFGAGDRAGSRAGRVRHAADFIVLAPTESSP